jgi:hypothetical protein
MRAAFASLLVLSACSLAPAYIHAPPTSLKSMCADSDAIRVLKVKARDKEKRGVTFEAGDVLLAREEKTGVEPLRLLARPDAPGAAEVLAALTAGEVVTVFTREHGTGADTVSYGYAHCAAGWFFVDYNAAGKFWLFVRAEPRLCECYSGKAADLPDLARAVIAGKQVDVPTRAAPKGSDNRLRALLVDEAMRKNRPTYPAEPLPTAWGKPANGVQAGLRLNPNVPYPGATAVLEVVVRNVGNKPVEFTHLQLEFAGDADAGTAVLKGAEHPSGMGLRLNILVSPGDAYALGRVPVYAPGKGPAKGAPPLPLGANRAGAEGVVLKLKGGTEVTLATGFLDLPEAKP